MLTVSEYNKLYGWKIPENCPVCNGKIEINSSYFAVCKNPSCEQKLFHRFMKLFETLGIKGAGDAFVGNLVKEVDTVEEFLEKYKEEGFMAKLAGVANGVKLQKQLDAALKKPISTAKYLATFDFQGFGEQKLLYLDFFDVNQYNISMTAIRSCKGFDLITSKALYDYLINNKEEIQRMTKYFNIENSKKSDILKGMSFCFTGSAVLPRSKLSEIVTENGGTVKSSVTKDLTYLCTDDTESGSSKNKKAKELGVKIISSSDFLKLAKFN